MQTACPIKYDRFLNRSILDINGYCHTQYDVLVSCRLGIVKFTLFFFAFSIFIPWICGLSYFLYTLQASLKQIKEQYNYFHK